MKVLLFGATGMVGQGVLRECLLADDVAQVTIVGRSPSGLGHAKLREVVLPDLFDYRDVALEGFDACFFCLGVSSAGISEAQYTRLTHDLTLAAAQALARLNRQMTFVYVSGAGTDSSEQGTSMWARVKGRTENALLRLPFKAVYLLRPGFIQPLHGAQSKTRSYRLLYSLIKPLNPLLKRILGRRMASTESMGRAMLNLARHGAPTAVLEAAAITDAAG
ncbi:MAG: NAD(P)H-binding protein [Pseudomonas sp.]|uniref:NAD(P)H-binding protein n=1 Tax=Pseudomonas abieticivorans TaxID=2931382 RepID=UPI0020BD52C7|nr:NAD(P)H-binding protein [Pseudomonas sp. PIA16]MDE1166461.1 NAD(P)H-binding protein [Pseudomonas sp.]